MSVQRKCEACRISDSECDSRRPKCSRCTAESIACVYPESQVDFVFVDQNEAAAAASRRAARRRSRESRRTTITLDTSSLEAGSSATTRSEQSPRLNAPVLLTLDDRVGQRFLSRWSAGQTSLGCLDSMPQLLEASGQDSAMRKAILATAYADLAVFERSGDRATRCYQAYFGALRRLRDELSEPNFVATDGVFAAVLTLDAFELLYMGRTDPLGIHTPAILRLLELRKDHITQHRQSFALWRSARQRIHVRQLFCEPMALAAVSEHGLAIDGDDRLEVRTIRFVADACDALSQLKRERDRPVEHANREEIARLGIVLRALMEDASAQSDHDASLPPPRRVQLNMQPDPELRQVFPNFSAVLYDNFWIARDRLLFSICSIKILDTLLGLRTESFSSRDTGLNEVDRSRDFLLTAQPDLINMQAKCRFALDLVPLFTGLVDSNGFSKIDPWMLNDTGVLTVKSILRTIGRLEYASPEIKNEANAILDFLNAHRHVMPMT